MVGEQTFSPFFVSVFRKTVSCRFSLSLLSYARIMNQMAFHGIRIGWAASKDLSASQVSDGVLDGLLACCWVKVDKK